MTNYFVGITAYDRPKRLQRLLIQLKQQRDVRLDVHVFHDGPPTPTVEASVGGSQTLHSTSVHLGKKGYYRLFNYVWQEAQALEDEWDYLLFLQDDVSIGNPSLLFEIGQNMKVLETEVMRLACLNLYGDGPWFEKIARWTARPAVMMENGFVFASWVDMVAACFTPLALEEVPVLWTPNFEGTEGTSSGVGRQLSKRFDEARTSQVMVETPVVDHDDGGESKMHPDRYEHNANGEVYHEDLR